MSLPIGGSLGLGGSMFAQNTAIGSGIGAGIEASGSDDKLNEN